MNVPNDIAETVLAANQRFYDAFEARDYDVLAALWDQSDRATCVHPGWPILRGWQAVGDSWRRIIDGPGRNQFILTNISVAVEGDVAWVVLDENLMANNSASTVAATNIFVRRGDMWLMVAHHGSPVMTG